MFRTMENIASTVEAAIVAVCLVAWAITGFPRFAEDASFGGVSLLCVCAYCAWMTWDAKK